MRDAPPFRRKCARNRDFFLKSLDFFRKPCYNKQRWFSHGFLPYSNPKIERCEPPNIKSAKKRVKVSEKKNLRNRMIKSAVRTSVKKLEAAIAADPQTANAQLVVTTSAIDKAASKGVMHKNAANRKKARLAKQLAKATV